MNLKIKPKSDAAISLRLPKTLLDKIESEAKRLGTTKSQLIVAILNKILKS